VCCARACCSSPHTHAHYNERHARAQLDGVLPATFPTVDPVNVFHFTTEINAQVRACTPYRCCYVCTLNTIISRPPPPPY
jgi:hypothetical protein